MIFNVNNTDPFIINRIDGRALFVPECKSCKGTLRPNISMRDDFDWIETKVEL